MTASKYILIFSTTVTTLFVLTCNLVTDMVRVIEGKII